MDCWEIAWVTSQMSYCRSKAFDHLVRVIELGQHFTPFLSTDQTFTEEGSELFWLKWHPQLINFKCRQKCLTAHIWQKYISSCYLTSKSFLLLSFKRQSGSKASRWSECNKILLSVVTFCQDFWLLISPLTSSLKPFKERKSAESFKWTLALHSVVCCIYCHPHIDFLKRVKTAK